MFGLPPARDLRWPVRRGRRPPVCRASTGARRKEASNRKLDEARHNGQMGEVLSASIARGAAEAVEVALGRILGGIRTRVEEAKQ